MDRDMYAEWLAKDAEYFQKILDHKKVQVKQFSKPVLKTLAKYSEEVKQEVAASSKLAKRVYESYTKFQKIYESHQRASEWAYVDALRNR